MASGAGAGRGMAQQSLRSIQQQQAAAELLRKQRKCVSCGNTAQARCEFRACGTCCGRSKNPCQVHTARQSASLTPEANPAARPQQYPWMNSMNMNMMSQYMRPSSPYVPSPYNMNPAMGYRYPYPSKLQTPQSEASKAAQLEKAKKAYIMAQKEAQLANALRAFKLREYTEAETAFSDEAFDRYLRNSSWLAEVMGFENEASGKGLVETPIDEARFVDAARAKYEGNSNRKKAQMEKLQRLVTKGMKKLTGDRDMENMNMYESRDFNQGRRDTKRMKIQTADGKECLRRINSWEDLFFQGIDSCSCSEDISLFKDSYRAAFGHDLGRKVIRKKPSEGQEKYKTHEETPAQVFQDDLGSKDEITHEKLVAQVPVMHLEMDIQHGYSVIEAL